MYRSRVRKLTIAGIIGYLAVMLVSALAASCAHAAKNSTLTIITPKGRQVFPWDALCVGYRLRYDGDDLVVECPAARRTWSTYVRVVKVCKPAKATTDGRTLAIVCSGKP